MRLHHGLFTAFTLLTLGLVASAQYGDISDVKLAKPEDKEDAKTVPRGRACIVLFDGKSRRQLDQGRTKEPEKAGVEDRGRRRMEVNGTGDLKTADFRRALQAARRVPRPHAQGERPGAATAASTCRDALRCRC